MSALDVVVERLELQGHRVTDTRRQVIDALLGSRALLSMDDILHAAPGVGRATVFRTVKMLLDLDVLCRVVMQDGTTRYRVSSSGHHHHLVCRSCGRVEDFAKCDVASLVKELARNTEYQIEGHWLEVYGRCADCRATEPEQAAG